jgi:phosphodiesterase/alkaline phosphatase D-like protein
MGKTAVISIVAIAAVVIIALFALYRNPSSTSPVATSTEPTSTGVTSTNVSGNPGTTGNPPASSQPAAPVAQTGSNAAVSNSTAVVTGNVTPNGAQTTYWYEYGKTTSLGSKTSNQVAGSGFRAIVAPGYIIGLAANTKYYYRLVARNSVGTATGDTLNFMTSNSPPPPRASAPTTQTLAASNVARTTANLNGRVNPNGSDTTYWFEYGTTADLGSVTASQSAGNGTASQSASVSLSGLEPLTKYYYRVNAQNQYGTVNGAITSFTTSGPRAPGTATVTTGSATNITTSSATLNGRLNPNGADTSYWFEYSQQSLLGGIIGNTTPQHSVGAGTATVNVSVDVPGLASDTAYFYRLVAQNQFGIVRGDMQRFTTKQ